MYRAQARGATLYGAELWGHSSVSTLVVTENRFLRQVMGLPASTPLISLRLDLGITPIEDEIALKPLTFWRRLWATPELAPYQADTNELLSYPGLVKRVPWFAHVKHECEKLGQPFMWSTPGDTCPSVPRALVPKTYCALKLGALQANHKLGSLTTQFLRVKDNYKLEIFLDDILPQAARKLYVQFRHGTLPVRAVTNKWAGQKEEGCPVCITQEETEMHVLFFCPGYQNARRYWLVQLCRNLGF